MSRLRSRSPHYRRFPWDEPDFDPRKVIEELDGNPRDRGHHPREDPEDFRDPYRQERYPEGPRRSPFQDDFHFRHQRHPDPDEFYHRRASPPHDVMHFENRRFSPRDEEGFDDDRRRGEFRDDYQRFDDREGVPQSRGTREGLSPTQRSTTDHQQRKAGMGWRRQEQGRDQGRFRDFSPGMRSSDQRAGGMEKEGRFPQHPNRSRQKENQRNDRGPPFKRPRREMEVVDHPGYRDMEDFGGRGYSVDRPKGGFRGRNRGTFFRGDSGPFVDEHSHDVEGGRNLPQFENVEDHRHYDSNFDQQRSPRSVGSSQERFRTSTARFSDREGTRGGNFQDNSRDSNYHEPRRSPNAMRYGNEGGPANYRGRGGYNQGRRGRSGPHRNQPRYQDLPQGEQREGCQPIRDDYKDPVEKVPNWKDENRLQRWRNSRSTSLEQNLRRDDLNPERPPQRKLGWNDPQTNNMMVITEETLTIKVDMSRPVNQNRGSVRNNVRKLLERGVDVPHSRCFTQVSTKSLTIKTPIEDVVRKIGLPPKLGSSCLKLKYILPVRQEEWYVNTIQEDPPDDSPGTSTRWSAGLPLSGAQEAFRGQGSCSGTQSGRLWDSNQKKQNLENLDLRDNPETILSNRRNVNPVYGERPLKAS
ncbi:hypothetical protein CRENBAI_024995 [Crenichthys baileyi]|uniref:Uncharacterized protein n=1 Tax=Crenichthys baileyi TaxID=28760 RepID=A0AAV9RP95_9TELE